jgi:hypothetical protein
MRQEDDKVMRQEDDKVMRLGGAEAL